MTEQEWLTSTDPAAMLDQVDGHVKTYLTGHREPVFRASDRKLRLFCCACCRERGSWPGLVDSYEEHGYHYPDDNGPPMSDLNWARAWTEKGEGKPKQSRKAEIMRCVFGNVFRPLKCSVTGNPLGTDTIQMSPDGSLKGCDCRWLTPDVLSVAQSIDDEGRWGEVGVLSDALEDAGRASERCKECHGSGTYTVQCTNAGVSSANGYGAATTYSEWRGCRHCGGDHNRKGSGYIPHPLVAHLRDGKRHHKGCWVVDALLGLS